MIHRPHRADTAASSLAQLFSIPNTTTICIRDSDTDTDGDTGSQKEVSSSDPH
jgi:hypothetical protein